MATKTQSVQEKQKGNSKTNSKPAKFSNESKTDEPDQSTNWFGNSRSYAEFAQRRANGEVHTPPFLLPDRERRLHIRRTLIEDHEFRIKNRPEGAEAKFEKLASSPFKFFRGTALLYYRDQAGTDAECPFVLTIGDVHPENFGVMPNQDGAPFFGINDFDEAYFAPFTWDIKRGSLGFYLSARQNGFSKKKSRRIVESFVRGYIAGLEMFARDDREKWHQLRIDNSPPMIRGLLEDAMTARAGFLKDLLDVEKGKFRSSEEIVPKSSRIKEFQDAIDHYREHSDIDVGGRAGHFEVKDVAVKKGSGTASLGLDRYFVLLDGPTDDPYDDLVLEIKQTRQSALHGLAPRSQDNDEQARRVFHAQHVHLTGGDPYYGFTKIGDISHLVRERSPYKDEIDLDDLGKKDFCEYASICGHTLAQAHARSDEDTGLTDGNAEAEILDYIQPDLFCFDMQCFAECAAKSLKRDFKLFKQDLQAGAYRAA